MWSIDGEATLQSVLDRPDCLPLFRRTLTGVLSWQMRDETLVRRVLTSPRAAPQWVAALLAMGATVVLEGEDGEREVALEALVGREVRGRVIALRVQPERPGLRWGEARVARTPADEPIVTAVAVVDLEGDAVRQARVALTGVWPEPVRLAQAPARLVGGPLEEARIRAVAEAVEKEVAPRGDFLGSREYRRAMAGVLTRRALEQCREKRTRRRGDAVTR
jgi:CO/xanthine dehydrogenase FAD-binding subunit